MSSEQSTIVVESLGKQYQIYAQPADRLKQMILPRLGRILGRARPTYFEEFWALRGVSFRVQRGETVGIIGRNGSGKSTLLQMICGTLHPTEGLVETNGRIAALLELGAGFNPDFTGRENVYLSGLLYGISESELRKRFESIVAFADIGKFIDQPVKTYSSGMYVRLAFAIAAHVDADTLVIDEALSVGDVRFTQKCMRYLRDFQKRGTLLFVSHDAGAVTSLCARAIWLDSGEMVMDGSARDVVERYLATQHAADRASVGESVAVHVGERESSKDGSAQVAVEDDLPLDIQDPRMDILNGTAARNLIKVFDFDPDQITNEFGAGAARIVNVQLLDKYGKEHRMMIGGEFTELVIEAEGLQSITAPIFGFYVKDRLGQRLFGDNTFITYHNGSLKIEPGQHLRARFRFRMPVLPSGDYSIDTALATGDQFDHTQQHWIHDAVVFKASESTMRYGLVGIPMHSITIEQVEA